MRTEIVNRVAEIMRNPTAAKKSKVDRELEARKDSVELSKDAAALAEAAKNVSGEYDKERALKVSRLEQMVQNGHYEMNDDMVDQIALRIIETL